MNKQHADFLTTFLVLMAVSLAACLILASKVALDELCSPGLPGDLPALDTLLALWMVMSATYCGSYGCASWQLLMAAILTA